jgi:competence protein ComEC
MAAQVNVTFLDVGQGDGTVISSPTGELILIDLGSKKNAEVAGADAIMTLVAMIGASMEHRHSDVPVLDRLLITHGDGDHYNLVTQLIGLVRFVLGKDLTINEVAIGGGKADYEKDFQTSVLTPAENAGKLTTFANSYHDPMAKDGTVKPTWTLANGTAKLYLLSANFPYRDSGPKNPKSLVVMLSYATANQNVILTGDAEEPTETAIRGYYAKNLKFLESFGLKLGHHGSQAGTSVKWLETVKQLASFASSDMKWAHPYCDTIARIAETIGPGAVLYQHQWLCGDGAGQNKEYRNFDDTNGFYTSMANMTDKPLDDPVDGKSYAPGLVQGIQYQLSLYDNGTMQLIDSLDHDSGIFDPSRSLLQTGLKVVAQSIEVEGFSFPMKVRANPSLDVLRTDQVM